MLVTKKIQSQKIDSQQNFQSQINFSHKSFSVPKFFQSQKNSSHTKIQSQKKFSPQICQSQKMFSHKKVLFKK